MLNSLLMRSSSSSRVYVSLAMRTQVPKPKSVPAFEGALPAPTVHGEMDSKFA